MAISVGVSRPFRVLVAGGSYGGLAATVHLLDHCSGAKAALTAAADAAAAATEAPNPSHIPVQPDTIPVEITVVDERDGFYHLIGTPLAFASESYAPKAWVKYTDIPALRGSNVHCLQGTISSISPEEKTATVIESESKEAKKLHYDYFIAATGLRRSWPTNPRSMRRKNYIFETESQISAMASTKGHGGAVIVGGGAVGIEMAAELKLCFPDLPVTLIHSRDKLLSAEPLPDEFKHASLDLVREMGIEVRLNSRLKSSHTVKDDSINRVNPIPATTGVELEFEDGSTMKAGEVVVAVSKAEPATNYLPAQALDDQKYIRVLPSLEFHPETGLANANFHFAAGDTVSWSGIKRCGAAMHMGMYAANNIYRSMLESLGMAGSPDLLELQEIPPMIGLAVGKKAVSYWPGQGTVTGEEVLQQMFQDDLGFKICWNHMMLGLTH